jgi:hypothetical protein
LNDGGDSFYFFKISEFTNNDMNETAEKLVRELAEKLGTTAEHLWGVLMRQAPITAATDSVTAAIMIGTLWALYRLVRMKTIKPPKSDDDRYPSAEWSQEGAFMSWLILAIYALLTLVTVFYAIGTVITTTMNPEYWVLKQLLP